MVTWLETGDTALKSKILLPDNSSTHLFNALLNSAFESLNALTNVA